MKKSALIIGMLLIYLGASAQQDPQFTQWMFDKVSFNPGATGAKALNCNAHCVSMFYRDQWDGLERDPKTNMFNYNGGFDAGPGTLGLGIVFAQDLLGQESNQLIKLNLAYHYPLSNGINVSGGLSFGSYGKTLGTEWNPTQEGDAIVDALREEERSAAFTDIGFGAMAYAQNWYAGLSATHLGDGALDDLSIEVIPHFYIMGGYNYALSTSTPMEIRTNALIKTDANANAIDINANLLWNDMIWGGLSFRPGDAIAPMVGLQHNLNAIKNKTSTYTHCFKLGYSYDATTSALNNHSTGSHEIFVTYCFNLEVIPILKPYNNPRFIHI